MGVAYFDAPIMARLKKVIFVSCISDNLLLFWGMIKASTSQPKRYLKASYFVYGATANDD
jgi:hypothetical protein